jgi:hypothetical protein
MIGHKSDQARGDGGSDTACRPLIPMTEATERLEYKSEGSTRFMVIEAA